MTIQDTLRSLELPALGERQTMLDLLEENVFGPVPAAVPVRAERLALWSDAYAGKAAHEQLLLHLALPDGDFAFPLHLVTPYAPAKALLLHLSFDPEMPNQYCLAEEIVDHGYAICQLCYTQVTSDDQDGENGLAAHFIGKDFAGRKTSKISLWAFAASRVIDYLKTLEPLKNLPIVLIGHSRLGKTALWCSANDPRVDVCYANESGCTGAALSRGKQGETVADIYRVFPHWFVPAYERYAGREASMPFDQHFLLALTAPRPLYCASAIEDLWAWPKNEFLGLCAASPAFDRGFAFSPEEELPSFETPFSRQEGGVGYHLRAGAHFLSREDYNRFYPWLERRLGL